VIFVSFVVKYFYNNYLKFWSRNIPK